MPSLGGVSVCRVKNKHRSSIRTVSGNVNTLSKLILGRKRSSLIIINADSIGSIHIWFMCAIFNTFLLHAIFDTLLNTKFVS